MSTPGGGEKILFVRHAAFGDVLLTTPFIQQLHEDLPGATIDLFSLSKEAVEGTPGLGRWISMGDVPQDRVFRSGYASVYWFSYEHDPTLHILDGYELSSGLKLRKRSLVWSVDPAQRSKAAWRMNGWRRPLIGFSPTCDHLLRTLPLPLIQRVVDSISERVGGTVVVTSDQRLDLTGCMNLTGQLSSLQELGAIIEACDIWVTVDSAPLHLAQALGVKAVGIFGCTLPELRVTRPSCLWVVRNQSLGCLGCYHSLAPHAEILATCERGDIACMEQLEPGAIVEAVQEALEGRTDRVLLDRMEAYERYRIDRIRSLPESYTETVIKVYKSRINQFKRRTGLLKRIERKLRNQRKSLAAWLLRRE